jgi:hypothetical protein
LRVDGAGQKLGRTTFHIHHFLNFGGLKLLSTTA